MITQKLEVATPGIVSARLMNFDDGEKLLVVEWTPKGFDNFWDHSDYLDVLDEPVCEALGSLDWNYGGGRAIRQPSLGLVREEIVLRVLS